MKITLTELIDSLNGLAMYNDKGYIFANHTESQQNLTRNSHRIYIHNFIDEYKTTLSQEAIDVLADEKLLFDGNGNYVEIIKKLITDGKIYKN